MATLTVFEYDTPSGAERAIAELGPLQEQRLIRILDAAVVRWENGTKKPQTRQLANVAGAGAMQGAFWGLLFGLIFWVPLLGAAVGAGLGALTASMTDFGIDDDFIKRVRADVIEGTSACFLLSSDAVPDRLADELRSRGAQPSRLIASNLSGEQEDRLRELFEVE